MFGWTGRSSLRPRKTPDLYIIRISFMDQARQLEHKLLSSLDNINLVNQLLQMLLSHSAPEDISQCLRSLRNVFKHYIYRVKALCFQSGASLELNTVSSKEEVQVFLGKKLKATLEIIYSQIFSPNLSSAL